MNRAASAPFRLLDVVVRPSRNLIEAAGDCRRLEPRVMELLLALARRPAEVVLRGELLERVWGERFVEEEVLTQAICALRRALGDDARRPRFVETVPKRGYRLMAPPAALSGAPPPPARRRRSRRWVLAAGLVLASGAVGAVVGLQNLASPAPEPLEARPFTVSPGRESQPAVSPDGRRVAFVRSGASGAGGLYLRTLAGGETKRLTDASGVATSPAWSPDGRRLAFARLAGGTCALIVKDLAGPSGRTVAPCPAGPPPYLAWRPDGKGLVVAEADPPLPRFRLVAVPLDGGPRRTLTTPPDGLGDRFPAVSPDGSLVAFARTSSLGASDLWLQPLAGGAPRRLTEDGDPISGIAWTSDGETLLYSVDHGGGFGLWRIGRDGGRPRWLPLAGGEARRPSVGAAALVFERTRFRSQVWRRSPGVRPRPLLSSTRWDEQPAVSPDGRRIAFVSDRSGRPEVWLADHDGRRPRRLTDLAPGTIAGVRWSSDGRRIALSARRSGQSDLYVVEVADRVTRRVTATAGSDEIAPAWSSDGRSLYFVGDLDAVWGIQRIPVGGGTPSRVLAAPASALWAAPDGGCLYFSRFDAAGIWRLPLDGASPPELVDPRLATTDYSHWGLVRDRLFFLDRHGPGPPRILALDPGTHAEETLGTAPVNSDDVGLSVSPAGELYYARADRAESDLYWLPRWR